MESKDPECEASRNRFRFPANRSFSRSSSASRCPSNPVGHGFVTAVVAEYEPLVLEGLVYGENPRMTLSEGGVS